jgi:serine/threonine protein kinase
MLELASGGMATVYLAYATDGRGTNPLVAIKRPHHHLASDKTFLSMLLDEARLASLIDHENVVKVRELGFHAGEPFIVLDYVEGASLSELRKELAAAERAVETRVAVRIALDALAGLHAAHEMRDETGKPLGIIHRDVSPHNVLIGYDGRARLTDFGIAKAADRLQTTRTHEVKGKLAYLAPERVDKRRMCTKQSDVFSMAVVLWECIAGRRLFRGEEAVDVLQDVMSAPIPRLRQLGARIPPALDDVIARALSRELDRRFLTAADFARAMEQAAGRANVGEPRDVARMIEAIFGPRLALRHEQIRRALQSASSAVELLRASGLPDRPRPASPIAPSTLAVLASVAPPAPSERYSFGQANGDYVGALAGRSRLGVLSGIAGGIAIGTIITLIVASRTSAQHQAALPSSSASAAAPAPPEPPPLVRRVVVPLPFIATRVRFDDVERDLDPAADVSVFDVPRESGPRHFVSATALDGTRAEGFVREEDGVVHVEPDGFSMAFPALQPDIPAPTPRQQAAPHPRPAGTVRNGFTKLK